MYFSSSCNGISTSDFSNIPKIASMYNSLGGNGSNGLPLWSNAYNQIIFPTNIRTYGNLVSDNACYFGSNGNLFGKYIYENDANFNLKNYLQIAIESDGTKQSGGVATAVGVAGIDFTSWNGRTNASCRIYGRDNADYSSDLYFVTAPSGSSTSKPTPRMVITADGYIGMNTTTPSYQLEVSGSAKFDAVTFSTLYGLEPSGVLSLGYNMTSGNIYLGNTPFFSGTLTIGNSAFRYNNINIYGSDCNLYGTNWKAYTQTAGDNSTKLSTTEFVQTAITNSITTITNSITNSVSANYLALTSTSNQNINSNVSITGNLTSVTPVAYTVSGVTTNQYDNVISNFDGSIVFTFATGGKILYGSYDYGKTWNTVYTATPVINNITCSGSGKLIFISLVSSACVYSTNYGASFQTMTISGVTTYYPITYVSCSYETSTTNFYICVTNNNTSASNRVDVYTSTTGPTGTFGSTSISGQTSYKITHDWCMAGLQVPTLVISTGLGGTTYQLLNPFSILNTVISTTQMYSKVRANSNGYYVQVGTSNGIYVSSKGGDNTTWSKAVTTSSVALSYHASKNTNIFAYSVGSTLYFSNNNHTSTVTPTYTSFYTASGNIKEIYISGNGLKVYFTVTGVLDTIYQINLSSPMSVYGTDFFVDKERQYLQAHQISDLQGSYTTVYQRNKTTQISLGYTLPLPLTEFYQLNGTTAYTITLPAITEQILNVQITLFHTGTKTVTISTNASDCIIAPIATIVYTATTYSFASSATLNSIRLLATLCPATTKNYCWVLV